MNLKIPEVIAIFGPGPSLDNVDYKTVPKFRLCLNFTYLVVKNPTAAISKDGHALREQIKQNNILTFCPRPDEFKDEFKSGYFVDVSGIKSTNGTLELAVLAAHSMGARMIHFYGIDSHFDDFGYAKKMNGVTEIKPVPGSVQGYKVILSNTMRIMRDHKITWRFHR